MMKHHALFSVSAVNNSRAGADIPIPLPGFSALSGSQAPLPAATELPLTVKEAAQFLGVSRQTVYLWVERKQIPHLRVMGRNIRFLKTELEPFRAQFRQEVENGKTEEA